VLVHGTRDTAAGFDRVRALLTDLDVSAYTRRGWQPGADIEPVSLQTHIDDLVDVLAERPSVVIGHSWGGHVAIGAAIRRPDLVRSVGIWETAMLWMPTWPLEHHRHLRTAMARVQRKLDESSERRHERTTFLAEASASFVQPFDLAELKVPCVVGVGGASLDVFGEGMRQVAALIGAEVFDIGDAGHMAHREHPDEFAQFVRRAASLAAA
jgi:pimeloyl-ACP methyl ester carboxylesterase